MTDKHWVCYTDGSKIGESTNDGGPGGWKVIVQYNIKTL